MIKEIVPCGPLKASFAVPGSKSITNRALVCAALADGQSLLKNASDSDDCALMVNALNQLGVLVRRNGGEMIVDGKGGKLFAPKFPIPVGNAGTTLRFLLSVAALGHGTTVLEGTDRMAERPNESLLDALRRQGIATGHRQGTSRFEVTGGALQGGEISVGSEGSSQYLSSLLLVAPFARTAATLRAEGALSSAPYVGLTLDVMRAFGAEVIENGSDSFTVSIQKRYQSTTFTVETDASGASYPMGAAAVAGGEVFIPGARENSRQGDAAFAGMLRAMGCEVRSRSNGLLVSRVGPLRGLDADMNSTPDLVPTLAAVALFAEGTTRMRNIAHVRLKESNRVEELARELSRLGAAVHATDDSLEIRPASLHGSLLDSHDDHRLAMSFALVGLRVPGVLIENPECVRKSFPTFWDEFDLMTRATLRTTTGTSTA